MWLWWVVYIDSSTTEGQALTSKAPTTLEVLLCRGRLRIVTPTLTCVLAFTYCSHEFGGRGYHRGDTLTGTVQTKHHGVRRIPRARLQRERSASNLVSCLVSCQPGVDQSEPSDDSELWFTGVV